MSFRLDTQEFQRTFNQYLGKTKRTLPEAINAKAFFIARRAAEHTPIAERGTIEAAFGVTGYKTRVSKKTGSFKRGTAILGGQGLYRLVNWQRAKKGLQGLSGKAMAKAEKRLLSTRLKAVGTLRAGWLHILRNYSSRIKAAFSVKASPKLKQKGRSKPATAGWSPVAMFEYRVTVKNRAGFAMIDPRVEAALARAFRDETASMKDYLVRKLQPIADRVNAR